MRLKKFWSRELHHWFFSVKVQGLINKKKSVKSHGIVLFFLKLIKFVRVHIRARRGKYCLDILDRGGNVSMLEQLCCQMSVICTAVTSQNSCRGRKLSWAPPPPVFRDRKFWAEVASLPKLHPSPTPNPNHFIFG